MKKILLFVLLFYSIGSHSQNAQDIIDKLKIQLKSEPNPKQTATIYSDLTWYYSKVSIDSALFYGDKAIESSKKLGDSVLIAQVFSDIGSVHFSNETFDKSLLFYNKSKNIRILLKDELGVAKTNTNIANIYNSQGKFNVAMKSYLEVIDFYKKTKNIKGENIVKGNLAALFLELKDYKKALLNINEVIKFNEGNKNKTSLCINYLTKGNVLIGMRDTTNAVKFYIKSKNNSQETGDKLTLSKALNNIGTIKLYQRKFKESEIEHKKVYQIRELLHSDLASARNKINSANILIEKYKFLEAKNMLLEIMKVFEKKKSYESLLTTYQMLVPVYAKLNQADSVVFYHQKYITDFKKFNDLYVNKQTTELETKYQTAKKEKLLLQNEIRIKQSKYILIFVSALTFLIMLIGFLIYRQQKLKNQQQNQEFKLKIAISQIETQNKLQDQRLTISRDLHDNIGAQLTFIISSVDNIEYAFDLQNSKLDDKLQKISSFTKETIVELRDTIWAMNNNAISFDDLRVRILNFTEKAKIAKENINFKFNIDDNLNTVELTSIVGMNIYRTIQEAVNNAVKYANPSEIAIIATKTNKIEITIADNGIGFDFNNVQKGNGIMNMQKRIEDIGGILNIETNADGTIIKIELH
jgi:signal transduction histidine kinase